jgi:hypothetical protein
MTLVLSGTTSAGIVNVNGMLDSKTEYEHKKDLQWFNEHHSIYGPVTPSHTGQTIEITYQINEDDSVNLFLEVPDYARRMIWTDLEYGPGKVENCDNPVDCKGIPEAILDAYLLGAQDMHPPENSNPHHETVKMNYETQTGSEYFKLNDLGLCFGLQDDGGHCADKTYKVPDADPDENDGIYWQTSRHWVLDTANGTGCTLTDCLAIDTTMSIELFITALGVDGLGYANANELLSSLVSFQLHLSDEARGISVVPVPAAFWLFGTALIGFMGFSRRTSLS